jgi:hypothetical protein
MDNKLVFKSFYDTYAPKIWGLILLANLPMSQSEAILINTLTKGWKNFNQNRLTQGQVLIMLINLARIEGLPVECLNPIFKHKL